MTKSQAEELNLIITQGKLGFPLERALKSLIAEIENDAVTNGYADGRHDGLEEAKIGVMP